MIHTWTNPETGVRYERVRMGELRDGDVVADNGMLIRISEPRRYVRWHPLDRAGTDCTSWHGDIINDFHPYGWVERTWRVQSADWVPWTRVVAVGV